MRRQIMRSQPWRAVCNKQAAMVVITGIVLVAVALARGHAFAGVRVARPTSRGLIECFGEYGASQSWVSPVQ